MSEIGVSPLKTHAISSHSIVSYGKKKLKQAQNVLEQKHSHIQTKIAESLQVSKNSLKNNNKEESVYAITQQKADDFDYLMNLIKEKINISSHQEKLQLLTLVPKTWEIRKVCEYFGVNPYTVKQARELSSLNGILTKPSPKRGKTIADEVVDPVKQFFL